MSKNKPCRKCGSMDRRDNGNCRPCNNEYARQWRIRNKEKVRIYNKDRNATWNKERNRRDASKYNKENPANSHNKRAELLGVTGTFTNQEWKELCHSIDYKCLRCNQTFSLAELTIDHKVPLSRGGTNFINNVQPLCKSCNAKKHTDTVDYMSNVPDNGIVQLGLWQ